MYEYMAGYYITLFCTCILVFLFGSCWFISSFAKDIRLELSAANQYYKLNLSKIHLNQDLHRIIGSYEIGKRSANIEFIFHYHIIQNIFSFRLSNDFTNIYEYVFTIYFMWTLTTICDTLLAFRIEFVKFYPWNC